MHVGILKTLKHFYIWKEHWTVWIPPLYKHIIASINYEEKNCHNVYIFGWTHSAQWKCRCVTNQPGLAHTSVHHCLLPFQNESVQTCISSGWQTHTESFLFYNGASYQVTQFEFTEISFDVSELLVPIYVPLFDMPAKYLGALSKLLQYWIELRPQQRTQSWLHGLHADSNGK